MNDKQERVESAQQAEPVAWRVHPFDYGIGVGSVYALTMRLDQVEAWKRKGWTVEPLYAQPPAAVQDEALLRQALEALEFVRSIESLGMVTDGAAKKAIAALRERLGEKA